MLRRVLHWGDACFPFSDGFKVKDPINMEHVLAQLDVIGEAPRVTVTRFLPGSQDSNATGGTDVVIMNNMASAEDNAI